MAAKEESVEQTAEDGNRNPAQNLLMQRLQLAIKQPGGLPIKILGDEPFDMVGGIIESVAMNSAWIAFAHDGCVFRTQTIKDRNAFWHWVENGGTPPDITFMKVSGKLKRPEMEQEKPKQQVGFVPRSNWGTMRVMPMIQ